MAKRRMKQRVAAALATVWLASIVGASVPSGETTAFSTPRPPGPSPDQYTPLFRNPRYYSQDDYSQDWMNDEPSRIKVANRRENSDQQKPAITDSDRSLSVESPPQEFFDRKIVQSRGDPVTPYRFHSHDMKTQSDLDREAMKLSSMKVAFDEPIGSEIAGDWMDDDIEDDEEMQQDGFFSDDTFEDEGPGSVEVYKLDLYKDRSILSPKLSRKNYLKNKSKIPKKVEAVDQITWKTKDPEESKQHLPKTVSRFDHHSDEFYPSRSFKDRIFGAGGVPELQVGCEGVEGSQRQKRSDSDQNDGTYDSTSARAKTVYLEADYDSEDESDEFGETDELFRILHEAGTTDSSLNTENRGDMNPRIKTPADLLAQKDKLPIRGDLGQSGDPNLTNTTQAQEKSSNENQSQLNSGRKLLSVEKEVAENVRNKRSLDWGYGETEGVTNERRRRRGHRGGRRNQDEKRRRRHQGERERDREGNKMKKRNKTIDKNGEDYVKKSEDHITRSQPSNLLRQLPTRKNERNKDYSRRHERQPKAEKQNEKKRKPRDEYDTKLEEWKRRNTPIQHIRYRENNHRRPQQDKDPRPPNSNNQIAQNLRLPVPSVQNNRGVDTYADRRRILLGQRPREVQHTNRTAYEQRRHSAERPRFQKQGQNKSYQQRSQQEIARLNALPISAYILIDKEKPKNSGPEITSRFSDEIRFPGLNPKNDGVQVPEFPTPATASPPVAGPSPCVWAIMTCCSNKNRLASCFEATGCSHGHWEEPCSQRNMFAALQTFSKFYGG